MPAGLGLHIEIALPGAPDRRAQIEAFSRDARVELKPADLDWLTERTEGYSGADLRLLISLFRMQSESGGNARERLESALLNVKRTTR